MRYNILLFLVLLSSASIFAQTEYKKGYFINNEGVNTPCLIWNEDWDENPFSFKYKLEVEGEVIVADIEEVRCFAIDTISKYLRRDVEIDMSADNGIENYSLQKSPEFEVQTLFLQVLVEGDLSLYYYKGDNRNRFFVKYKDEEIIQLIYKWHYTESGDISENELYKGQLAAYMQCDDELKYQIEDLRYVKKNLVRLFKSYDDCKDQPSKYYQDKRKGLLKLNVSVGGCYSAIDVATKTVIKDYDLSGIYGFSIGAEFEYFFPVKNNKLSLIFEPSVQIESADFNISNRFYAEYYLNKLSAPIGLRYSGRFHNKSRLFFDAGLMFSCTMKSGIDTYNRTLQGEPSSHIHYLQFASFVPGLFLGAGYNYNDLLLEVRYNGINQNLTNRDEYWKVKQNSLQLRVSYTFDLGKK